MHVSSIYTSAADAFGTDYHPAPIDTQHIGPETSMD